MKQTFLSASFPFRDFGEGRFLSPPMVERSRHLNFLDWANLQQTDTTEPAAACYLHWGMRHYSVWGHMFPGCCFVLLFLKLPSTHPLCLWKDSIKSKSVITFLMLKVISTSIWWGLTVRKCHAPRDKGWVHDGSWGGICWPAVVAWCHAVRPLGNWVGGCPVGNCCIVTWKN